MGAPAHYLADQARQKGASEGYNRAVKDIGDRIRGYAYGLIEQGQQEGREFLVLADVIQGAYPVLPIERSYHQIKGDHVRWIEERGSRDDKQFRAVHDGQPLEWQTPAKWFKMDDDIRALRDAWKKDGWRYPWEDK